ncbi:hypothetical protein [Nesterenkonia sp. CF4.4]|uniref:hypothetical protein n=1 Tax=Nesterenkonia sp. CF4.4 TaxID=3373079 RepID=UPI003EE59E5B
MPETVRRAEDARITYVYLRVLLILLPGLLLVVTAGTSIYHGELETSISAYYGGPVRDVFVGCLIALAACLVAYQGIGLLEDYALNGAGFYAIFVALVPNNFEDTMEMLLAGGGPDGLTAADYVVFLRITLLSVVVLCLLLFAREIKVGNLGQLYASNTRSAKIDRLNRAFVLATMLTLIWFLALAMRQLFLVPAEEVRLQGVGPFSVHDIAGIFLISSLVVAVATNTWPYYRMRDLWVTRRFSYLIILGLMTVGVVVPFAIAELIAPGHFVILLEWWEISLFAAFWILETLRQLKVDKERPSESAPAGLLEEPSRH